MSQFKMPNLESDFCSCCFNTLAMLYFYRGSVANMLVTSCKDSICRIWVETIVPDDGLVDLAQFDPLVKTHHYQTQRQKHKIMSRLKHIR